MNFNQKFILSKNILRPPRSFSSKNPETPLFYVKNKRAKLNMQLKVYIWVFWGNRRQFFKYFSTENVLAPSYSLLQKVQATTF